MNRIRDVDISYVGDRVESLSTVIIVAQSDMKYLMKVNPEQLFYESGHGGMIGTLFTTSMIRYFSRGSFFKDSYFLEKTSFFLENHLF